MKAIVQERYGELVDVLDLREVDAPAVRDGEVLISVQAAAIHIGDIYTIKGVPYALRAMYGLRRPKQRIPGSDISGIVEEVGAEITRFAPGDEVFGWGKGALAEQISVAENGLTLKPAYLSFDQAAALGVSAFTAMQALRDHGKLEPEDRVLVNGASGGVGTFAVQIAKAFGAEVTGVCSTRSVELVRSIGADHVIDYTEDDFTRRPERYELIFDNVGNHPMSRVRDALTPDGILLSNGAPVGGWFGGVDHVLKASVASFFEEQQARPFVSIPNQKDLAVLQKLAEVGAVTPVVGRTYPLSEAVAAAVHVEERHTAGTTVIAVRAPNVSLVSGPPDPVPEGL